MTETFILVGLGNPGDKYTSTRHNVGFDVIDHFAGLHSVSVTQQKWDALTVRINSHGANIHLVKPMTYMNRSGSAVARFIDFYKVPLTNIVVIHDDLDMHTGRLKLVSGGGAGGHNGIRSIVSSTGESGFFRLKVGIGRPGNGLAPAEMPVDRYVLTSFYDEEAKLIAERMTDIMKGLQIFFESDAKRAMNYLNSIK